LSASPAWAQDVLLENGAYTIAVDVVLLGVDRSLFHDRLDAGPARRETVFAHVGKLEARKHQLGLLRAYEPSPPVRLVLACHHPFLWAANSRLVTINALAPAAGGSEGAAWAQWGEAQHEQLVSHWRAVHTARVEGTLSRNDAGIEMATHYSWQHSARLLLAAIGRV
jgi:hypothetical protein